MKLDDNASYKCPDCEHVCKPPEMEADYAEMGDGEAWSNWICPECGVWHMESDWIPQ